MFAVIRTGGKQYKVSKDDVLVVEKLAADPGDTVTFDKVLMLGGADAAIGDPLVDGASVLAEVVAQGRDKKVYNFKKRRRKHGSKRLKGHRQYITTVRVTDVLAPGQTAAAPEPAVEAAPAPAPEPAAEPVEAPAEPAGEAVDTTKSE